MSFAEMFLGGPEPTGVFTDQMLVRFLSLSVEEGLNLDYKSIASFKNPDKLAIVATAFANAQGGLLVLGVDEKVEQDENGRTVRIRPGGVTWGPKSLAREKVESTLVARIHPWIQGLRIFPIRNESEEVVFLIEVPQSMKPPHQGPDGRYYLRYNFQNLPMEHHQVEDLFFRRMRPDIVPRIDILGYKPEDSSATIRIGLSNAGGVIGKQVLFYGDFMNCIKVEDKDKKWFLTIEPFPGVERRYIVSYQSPIMVIHPTMINYPAKVEVTLAGPIMMAISIGAEDSPTRQFWSGFSPKYLSTLDHDFAKKPLPLVVLSLEREFEKEGYTSILRQLGVDPEEFEKLLIQMATAREPEDVKKASEALAAFLGRIVE